MGLVCWGGAAPNLQPLAPLVRTDTGHTMLLALVTRAPCPAPPLARIAVQAPNTLFYYALVARDAAGNVSPMSNLVAVLLPQQLTSPAPSQQRLGCQS